MDNKNEIFPVVDEDGNVTGSVTRGKAHCGSKYCTLLYTCIFSTLQEKYIYKKDQNGKTYNPENGIQQPVDMSIWKKA